MSSFKRKIKTPVVSEGVAESATTTKEEEGTAAVVSGVRAWAQTGLGMVSAGLRELNDNLMGGIPAGSLVCYLLDEYSNYGETLLGYSVAEGLSHNQRCLLCGSEDQVIENVVRLLPLNLHYEKATGGVEDTVKKEELPQDSGLKIAWQYEKYLSTPKNSEAVDRLSASAYCSSFDLARPLQPALIAGRFEAHTIATSSPSDRPLDEVLKALLSRIARFVASESSKSAQNVSRVFILRLEDILTPYLLSSSSSSSLSSSSASTVLRTFGRFLLALKQLIQTQRCVCSLSCTPSHTSSALAQLLLQTCDIVFEVESFAGRAQKVPAEFKALSAFFAIRRAVSAGALCSANVTASKFGLKRDRRKLQIERLHLPPEESRAMASSNAVSGSSATTSNSSHNHNHIALQIEPSHAHPHAHSPTPSPSLTAAHQPFDHNHNRNHNHSHGLSSTSAPDLQQQQPADPRKLSLAASLASARAARAAAGASAGATSSVDPARMQPISISSSNPSTKAHSLDF